MAQEQRLNLDLFQAQKDLENLEVDFNNVNLGLVDSQTYNLDVILNEIDMVIELFKKMFQVLGDHDNFNNTLFQYALIIILILFTLLRQTVLLCMCYIYLLSIIFYHLIILNLPHLMLDDVMGWHYLKLILGFMIFLQCHTNLLTLLISVVHILQDCVLIRLQSSILSPLYIGTLKIPIHSLSWFVLVHDMSSGCGNVLHH